MLANPPILFVIIPGMLTRTLSDATRRFARILIWYADYNLVALSALPAHECPIRNSFQVVSDYHHIRPAPPIFIRDAISVILLI